MKPMSLSNICNGYNEWFYDLCCKNNKLNCYYYQQMENLNGFLMFGNSRARSMIKKELLNK